MKWAFVGATACKCLSGPAMVPLGSLCVPLGACDGASQEPPQSSQTLGACYGASRGLPNASRVPLGTLRNPSGGLPLKLLAYWEEAEHAAGVDEQDVLCANECAALF